MENQNPTIEMESLIAALGMRDIEILMLRQQVRSLSERVAELAAKEAKTEAV